MIQQIWQWLTKRPWMVLIIVVAILPLTWFGSARLFTGTDINFPLNPIARFTGLFSLWDARTQTGQDQSVLLTTMPFDAVQALVKTTGASITIVEKAELVFWLGTIALAVAFFMNQLFADQSDRARIWGITLGVAVYIFNPFLIDRINEIDVATLGAMVAMPIIFGCALAVWNKRIKPWRAAIGATFASLVGAGLFANPPLVLVILIFSIGFILIGLLTNNRSGNFRFIQFIFFFLLLFSLINLWWLLPYAQSLRTLAGSSSGGLGGLNLLNWIDGVSKHNSFWNVLRMQGAWDWYETGIGGVLYVPFASIYQNSKIFLGLSLVLPAGALLSVLSLRKATWSQRILWIFLAISLVISLIYSMGTFNSASRWLYGHTANIIPFFSLIRSPWYKFGYVTTLAYSTLIAWLSIWLANRIPNRWLRSGVLGALMIAIVVYAFPLINGQRYLFAYTRLKSIPSYVTTATDYLNSQPDTHRVVTLPQEIAFDYTWGYGSGGDILTNLLHRPVLSNTTFSSGDRTGSDALLASFYNALYKDTPNATRLLDYLDANWFIHKTDAKVSDYARNDDSFFIRNRISKQSDVVLDRTFGAWDIYKRATPPPGRVVASTQVWTVFGDVNQSIQALPDLLNHTLSDNQFVSFYLRSEGKTAGQGSTRSILLKQFPFVQSGGPIQNLDFSAPFFGTITTDILSGSTINPVVLNGKTVTPNGQNQLGQSQNSIATTASPNVNLLKNPSFANKINFSLTDSGPWQFVDCSGKTRTEAHFDVKSVKGSDANPGIQLSATNHILAAYQSVTNLAPQTILRLSFDYRNIEGQVPSFAYSYNKDDNNVVIGGSQLTSSSNWQHVETYFETNEDTTGLTVYLYAGAKDGQTTVNEYDNVQLHAINSAKTLALLSAETPTSPPPSVQATQNSNTKWTVQVGPSQSRYLLSFLETYNPGWVATINGKQVSADNHVEIDGYANAWWLEPNLEPITVVLEYSPQHQFMMAIWISIASGTIALLLLFIYRSQKTKQKTD